MGVWFISMMVWHPAEVGAGCCLVSCLLIDSRSVLTTCWEIPLPHWIFHVSFHKWRCGMTGRRVVIYTSESFKYLLRPRPFLIKTLKHVVCFCCSSIFLYYPVYLGGPFWGQWGTIVNNHKPMLRVSWGDLLLSPPPLHPLSQSVCWSSGHWPPKGNKAKRLAVSVR